MVRSTLACLQRLADALGLALRIAGAGSYYRRRRIAIDTGIRASNCQLSGMVGTHTMKVCVVDFRIIMTLSNALCRRDTQTWVLLCLQETVSHCIRLRDGPALNLTCVCPGLELLQRMGLRS